MFKIKANQINHKIKMHRNHQRLKEFMPFGYAFFHIFWKSNQAKSTPDRYRALPLWRHYAKPRSIWPTMKITTTPTTILPVIWDEKCIFLFKQRKCNSHKLWFHTEHVWTRKHFQFKTTHVCTSQRQRATLQYWSVRILFFFILLLKMTRI